jgi:hypothetical protein
METDSTTTVGAVASAGTGGEVVAMGETEEEIEAVSTDIAVPQKQQCSDHLRGWQAAAWLAYAIRRIALSRS